MKKWILAGSCFLMTLSITGAQPLPGQPEEGVVLFNKKCTACHAIGKVVVGPDLKPAGSKTDGDLNLAFNRMEPMAGTLSPQNRADLMAFFRAGNLDSLLNPPRKAEVAEILPGNSATGGALYYGDKRLQNGGMACVSCHSSFRNSGLGGGKLGVPLTGAFSKFGGSGLTSAIQSAAFPTMREPYRLHEITQAEAEHLAAYLQKNDREPEYSDRFTFLFYSVTGALGVFGLLGILYRNRLISVRQTVKP